MFNDIFFAVIMCCGFVVGRNAYINILEMDRHTRHTIRLSYILLCLGVIVLFVSVMPAFRVFLLGGTASILAGAAGLVLFNKRRLFERDAQDRTLVIGDDDRTRTVERRAA
jgi:predicted ABC-type exoprotein transport system permease subunit